MTRNKAIERLGGDIVLFKPPVEIEKGVWAFDPKDKRGQTAVVTEDGRLITYGAYVAMKVNEE